MKRITSLDINAEGPFKVKKHIVILRGQVKAAKEEEMEYTTSYHVKAEEHLSLEFEDDDLPKAPPELEDGGKPIVDELKELSLGTPGQPRLVFVSALLSSEEQKPCLDLLSKYRNVFVWSYKMKCQG